MELDQIRDPRWELSRLERPPAERVRQDLAIASPVARARREHVSTVAEMVTSHVETLIERVTGIEKAVPDCDGVYAVRLQGVVYYVRILGAGDQPLVQIFSPVVCNVTATAELFQAVNEVNTRLGFLRCVFNEDSVVIEIEHLGTTLRTEDFRELSKHIVGSSAFFGPMLRERFGGTLPYSVGAAEDEAPTGAAATIGLYL